MLKRKQHGFTIVELLIVIVVIGILAAISIVAYNGIQSRANDTRIKTAVNQLEKSMLLWSSENGNQIIGGSGSTTAVGSSGCVDGSSGWFSTGIYTCSQEDTLIATGNLPPGFTQSLPKNINITYASDGRYSLMLYPCGTGKHILFWTLRSPSASDTTEFDAARSQCGYATNNSFRDSYGMRNARVINML